MKKILSMEGLRGVAALCVVLEHHMYAFFPFLMIDATHYSGMLPIANQLAYSPLNLIYNGNSAVCIFFVISGLVLSYSTFQDPTQRSWNVLLGKSFKRYFRLALPVMGAVLLVFAIFQINGFYFGDVTYRVDSVNPDYYRHPVSILGAVQLGFYEVMLEGKSDYNPALWTMQIELFGSLLVFVLLAALVRFSIKVRLYAYLALSAALLGTYLWAFVAGMMIADLVTHPSTAFRLKRTSKYWLLPVLLTALFLLGFTLKGLDSGLYGFMMLPLREIEAQYHIAGAILLILAILHFSPLAKLLSSTWFCYLGKISFPIYLLHYPLMASVTCYVYLQLVGEYGHYGAIFVSFVFAGFPTTILSAIIFERYVNRPAIRLANKIGSWITENCDLSTVETKKYKPY